MKVPPPPRGVQYSLGIVNLTIFIFATVMIATGAASLLGYASIFQDDLAKLSASISQFISPEMTSYLTNAMNYAPTVLIVIGAFLAVVSFAGCCGAFNRSRTLLQGYMGIVVLLLVMQLGIVLYTYHQGDVVSSMWDKSCPCEGGLNCKPQTTQCLHPESPVVCPAGKDPSTCTTNCQPCKDYFEATVCAGPDYATAIACTTRIQELLSANIRTLTYIIVAVLFLEVFCLGAARRVLRWLRDREEAEKAEEALLAETYRLHKGMPYPGA